MSRTKQLVVAAMMAAGALIPAGVAGAAANPSGTGQPSASCEDSTSAPPGFSSGGFANAELHYAGTQPQNSKNAHSVSQYDVACFQVSQH